MLPLAGFDVIILRSNPPLDMIMLNFLDSVKNDVFIMNDLDGIRRANNKLYTAVFEDENNEIIPRTHITKNKEYLKKIIKEGLADKIKFRNRAFDRNDNENSKLEFILQNLK